MIADSHHVEEEQEQEPDLDPHCGEKLGPDPHLRDAKDGRCTPFYEQAFMTHDIPVNSLLHLFLPVKRAHFQGWLSSTFSFVVSNSEKKSKQNKRINVRAKSQNKLAR